MGSPTLNKYVNPLPPPPPPPTLGNITCFLQSDFFPNQLTIRVSNSLDPDQAQHFVGPDLGPNRLQRLSDMTLEIKELTR